MPLLLVTIAGVFPAGIVTAELDEDRQPGVTAAFSMSSRAAASPEAPLTSSRLIRHLESVGSGCSKPKSHLADECFHDPRSPKADHCYGDTRIVRNHKRDPQARVRIGAAASAGDCPSFDPVLAECRAGTAGCKNARLPMQSRSRALHHGPADEVRRFVSRDRNVAKAMVGPTGRRQVKALVGKCGHCARSRRAGRRVGLSVAVYLLDEREHEVARQSVSVV